MYFMMTYHHANGFAGYREEEQCSKIAEAEGEVRILLNRFKPASNFVLLIVPRRYFCGGSFCFMSWCLKFFVLLAPYVCFHIFN